MTSLRTLLVEDDATTRRLLQSTLEGRGYAVTACADAESAWEKCRHEAFEIMVLDWLLPGMDGLELCRRWRAHPDGDRSFVIILTGRDQPSDLQVVLDAGSDDYLTKPLDIPRLQVRLSIAERQIEHRRQRRLAEGNAARSLAELQKAHDDLLLVLNQLRIGCVITDADGQITFFSEVCRELFDVSPSQVLGHSWQSALPVTREVQAELQRMVGLPRHDRVKVVAHGEAASGTRFSIEIEVKDDPADAQRRMFFVYDISEVHDLRRMLSGRAQFEDLIGKSEPMLRVFQLIRDVAAVDATVLIEGETGTGKELVARALHVTSVRRDRPFIAVNCAGLTESLLGSQLFGHKRGAFTGAIEDHKGLFEAADGGTVFLDEIGDVPQSVQTMLLRVLQEREVVRLGETKPRKIDVRVVAATHHNLTEDVAKGSFRADLLYRIRVARIHLPPLRQRRQDIPLLAAAFLREFRATTGKRVEDFTTEAMSLLLNYDWPGNVRELRGAIEFAMIRAAGSMIGSADWPPEMQIGADGVSDVRMNLPPGADEAQRILAALEQSRGNRVVAARLLGMSRATLYRRLSELNLEVK